MAFSKEDTEAVTIGRVPAGDQEPPRGPVQTSWASLPAKGLASYMML